MRRCHRLLDLDNSITKSPNGFDAVRRFPQFLTEPSNVGIDGARVDDAFVTPDLIEERVAALDAAASLHQQGEQLELGRSKIDRFTANRDLVTGTVHLNVAELDDL